MELPYKSGCLDVIFGIVFILLPFVILLLAMLKFLAEFSGWFNGLV